MSKQFNRDAFVGAFRVALEMLAQSEVVTRRELMHLSRSVLEATHETGDIQYINKLISILTPVNKKVAIVFFRHFSGFSFDDKLVMFTKKSKKRYNESFAEYVLFMENPHNNIWTWAERNIEIEQKAFDVKKVTDYVKNALKHVDQVAVMKAVIAAGITAETVIAIMEDVGLEANVAEEE